MDDSDEPACAWRTTAAGHVLVDVATGAVQGHVRRVRNDDGRRRYQWGLSAAAAPCKGEKALKGPAKTLSVAKRCVERHVDVRISSETDAAYVYVLRAIGEQLTYVGWTKDVGRRLEAHNSGRGARSTRGRRWEIIHIEEYPSRRLAMAREVALKRDRGLRRRLARTVVNAGA